MNLFRRSKSTPTRSACTLTLFWCPGSNNAPSVFVYARPWSPGAHAYETAVKLSGPARASLQKSFNGRVSLALSATPATWSGLEDLLQQAKAAPVSELPVLHERISTTLATMCEQLVELNTATQPHSYAS